VYLLGHIALGYTIAWLVAKSRKQTLILWAVFTASILPDFDILLMGFGLRHDTYSHSLILLGLLSIALIAWNRKAMPYTAALLGHVVIDMLIGPVGILLPLSRATYSLNLQMGSTADAIIEIGALALMILIMISNNDLQILLRGNRENILILLPLFAVAASALRAASRIAVWRGTIIISFGSSATNLAIITGGHIVLVALLTYSVIKGLTSKKDLK
jgi:hypothetical protein